MKSKLITWKYGYMNKKYIWAKRENRDLTKEGEYLYNIWMMKDTEYARLTTYVTKNIDQLGQIILSYKLRCK